MRRAKLRHHSQRGGRTHQNEAGQILMAIGHRPNVEKLLGKDISLEMEGGKIAVNSDFETSEAGNLRHRGCVRQDTAGPRGSGSGYICGGKDSRKAPQH